MTSHPPLVSVVIPTFNRGWCITEAVSSVLDQTYTPLELIVVDDGSFDDTCDKLSPFRDRLTLIHQENQGVSAARNRGIRECRGELIAFLDSDDLWTPDKIHCQVRFFEAHPDAVICQTEEIWIRNGRRVNPMKKHQKPSGMIFEPSLNLCLVSPSAVMMRRSFFDIKGYFDETLPACEDYDLWLRTAVDTPIHLLDRPCTIKTGGHEDQLSAGHSLDRYRIQSLSRLIRRPEMSDQHRRQAVRVLREKCTIYGNGCIKRGKLREGREYLDRAKQLSS